MKKILVLVAGIFTLSSASADSEVPSVEQAQQAISKAFEGRKEELRRPLKVEKVLGCLPAFGELNNVLVCPVNWISPLGEGESSTTPVPFRFDGKSWSVVKETNPSAACAPLKTAEEAFRRRFGKAKLMVKSEVDKGEGIFTDERGITRNDKGPYRLMCRYEVDDSGEDKLYVTYVWYDKGRYVIDQDWEIW